MKKMKLNIQLFASGTFNVSTGNANISGYVQMTSASNGSSANSSNVTATLYLRRTNNYTGSASSTASFSVTFTINGTQKTVTASSRVTIPNDKSYVNLGSASVTVPHNADGNKTCSITVSTSSTNSSFVVPATTGSLKLDTIPRYASITSFTVDKRDEISVKFNYTADSTLDWVWYSTDNGATWNDLPNNGVVGGLSPNTTYNFKLKIRRADSQLTTDSWTVQQTTYDYPYCTSAPSFTIEDNVVLKFYNPLNRTFSLTIIGDDSSELFTVNASGTERDSLGSTSTINKLYATIPNKTSGKYKVKVVYGSNANTKQGGTYSVNKTTNLPTFTNFNYKDTSANCVALTGNDQKFINGISDVKVIISSSNKMVAKNSAVPKKYRISIGNITQEVNYSDTNDVSATFNDVATGTITVTAIDSRGYDTTASKTATILPYLEPTFSSIKVGRQNGVGTVLDLSVSGNYSTTNFGNATNTILNVAYTKDNGENWIDITDKFVFTNGTFSSIAGATLPDFELGKEYEVTFMVTDGGVVSGTNYALKSVSSTKQTINSGQPTLDINKTKKGVGINCIAKAKGLWIDGHNLLDIIYPVGAIYMSVNDVNPSNLLGGTWQRLQNRFLVGAGDTYSNGATGGNNSISYTPSGSVANHTLTTSQIPSHSHTRGTMNITGSFITRPMANDGNIADARGTNAFYYTKDGGGENWFTALSHQGTSSVGLPTDLITFDASKTWSGSTSNVGGGGSHNHGFTGTKATINTLPPYLAVYMWKRTA